jgi:hypothetical protein
MKILGPMRADNGLRLFMMRNGSGGIGVEVKFQGARGGMNSGVVFEG